VSGPLSLVTILKGSLASESAVLKLSGKALKFFEGRACGARSLAPSLPRSFSPFLFPSSLSAVSSPSLRPTPPHPTPPHPTPPHPTPPLAASLTRSLDSQNASCMQAVCACAVYDGEQAAFEAICAGLIPKGSVLVIRQETILFAHYGMCTHAHAAAAGL
jgi:hypothetical protein